jgi:hypothetical protein
VRVIDTDVLPLMEVAVEDKARCRKRKRNRDRSATDGRRGQRGKEGKEGKEGKGDPRPKPQRGAAACFAEKATGIKDAKDLEPYEHVFADVEYWKKDRRGIPEPADRDRHGHVHAAPAVGHRAARRRSVRLVRPPPRRPVRTYMERKGYILQPKFIFIDGRTGTVMHSENFREEVLYNANQSTPALSSYFELMDRLIPSFLSTLSSQKIKGTRVLSQ